MVNGNWVLCGAIVAMVGISGCGSESADRGATTSATDSAYVTASEPAGALAVGTAREEIADDEDVILVGRIGGSTEPFVDGVAAFTIVDEKVPYCAADEGCPTPWDYCCQQNAVKENIATVKIVDDAGEPVAQDARQLLGVEELDLVVLRGTADRDENGNLAVLAREVYVKGK